MATTNTDQSTPAISVIIPLYNSERFIRECLISVLASKFTDYEVIIVDDCSTDNSVEVVKNYAPKFEGRLVITKTAKTSGDTAEPGNLGVALSRGDYLLILDSDGTITPDALDKLYKVAKNFDADVVAPGNGGIVNKPTLIPFDVARRVREVHDRKFSCSLSQMLIRRDFLIKNKIRLANTFMKDFLTASCLAYTAERFVRVPYVINNCREKRDAPSKQPQTYLREAKIGFDYLEAFLNDAEYFRQNPGDKRLAVDSYFKEIWSAYLKEVFGKISARERENLLLKEFAVADNNSSGSFLLHLMKYLK